MIHSGYRLFPRGQHHQNWFRCCFESFSPFADPALSDVNRAKFLSDFEKPTFFRDFPFDLSFIYSEKIKGNAVARNEQKFDLNQGLVGGIEEDGLDASQHTHVNRMILKDDYDAAKEVDVWLSLDNDVMAEPELYVDPGYVETTYVEPAPPPIAQPVPSTPG